MSSNGKSAMSSAVMNQRAPRLVEADDATRARWRKLDWFATPPWATRAGAELIKRIDPAGQQVWEPAAGDRIMGEVLHETFSIYTSDIHPQAPLVAKIDFLDPDAVTPDLWRGCDWIITNPPFALAKQFTKRALTIAHRGVAMLCRLNWLESADRHELFHGEAPLTWCFPFAERVPMQLGPWDPDCSSATAYAWFVWQKNIPPMRSTFLEGNFWAGGIIPPGTRARLTRKDDVTRFCAPSAAPLLNTARNPARENEDVT